MISIITITYNNYEDLVKTLGSIDINESIESVVINGGDCDKTSELLKSYDGIAISEKDNGISDAFNKGIKNSSGRYIMFLNSGDELTDKSYPQKAGEFLDIRKEYSFVHSNILFVDDSGETLHIRPPMKNPGRGMPYLHPTMVVRREVFDKVGLFRGEFRIAMDFDLIVKMEKAGLKGFYFDGIFPVKMEGSGKSVKQEYLAIKECFRILKENRYLNLRTVTGFGVRYFFFMIRKFMGMAGLSDYLLKMKKLKHNG